FVSEARQQLCAIQNVADRLLVRVMLSQLCLIACSTQATIPTLSDDLMESFVRTEPERIIPY
ncbi:MAG TPA: hypothetical protein VF452_13030, partial [Candidatus Binatia bacterium]